MLPFATMFYSTLIIVGCILLCIVVMSFVIYFSIMKTKNKIIDEVIHAQLTTSVEYKKLHDRINMSNTVINKIFESLNQIQILLRQDDTSESKQINYTILLDRLNTIMLIYNSNMVYDVEMQGFPNEIVTEVNSINASLTKLYSQISRVDELEYNLKSTTNEIHNSDSASSITIDNNRESIKTVDECN